MPSHYRLYPQPAATVTAAQVVASLDPGASAVADRPYVICNFVATADDKATVDGRSGPLGDEADHELFQRLRTRVDAVLVGAGTLRIERYGRLVRDPELRSARQRAGPRPDPLACVVTRSLRLTVDIPIFQDPDSTIAVYTSAVKPFPVTAALHTCAPTTKLVPSFAKAAPRSSDCCSPSSSSNEFFLSIFTTLAGGAELPISTGQPLPETTKLRLLSVLEHQSSPLPALRSHLPLI